MTNSVACVTMVYNEPEYLPIWMGYYGSQVGASNCFLVDHGSEDGSTSLPYGANTVTLPRSPQDEVRRVQIMSDYCKSLLKHYQVVIYTDVDEILVPNPTKFSGLEAFCKTMTADTVTAVGLNVHHMVGLEAAFDRALSVLEQRCWVRFVSPMCKPLVTRVPTKWGRGFHSCDRPLNLGDIFLFHLRYYDLTVGLTRLSRTRALARKTESDVRSAQHQRMADDAFLGLMQTVSAMDKVAPEVLSSESEPVRSWLKKAATSDSGEMLAQVRMDVFANTLWKIPAIFRGIF